MDTNAVSDPGGLTGICSARHCSPEALRPARVAGRRGSRFLGEVCQHGERRPGTRLPFAGSGDARHRETCPAPAPRRRLPGALVPADAGADASCCRSWSTRSARMLTQRTSTSAPSGSSDQRWFSRSYTYRIIPGTAVSARHVPHAVARHVGAHDDGSQFVPNELRQVVVGGTAQHPKVQCQDAGGSCSSRAAPASGGGPPHAVPAGTVGRHRAGCPPQTTGPHWSLLLLHHLVQGRTAV